MSGFGRLWSDQVGVAGWVGRVWFCFVLFRLVSFAGFRVESPARRDGPGPISALSRPRFGVVTVRSRDDSKTARPMAGAEKAVDAFHAHRSFLVYLGRAGTGCHVVETLFCFLRRLPIGLRESRDGNSGSLGLGLSSHSLYRLPLRCWRDR